MGSRRGTTVSYCKTSLDYHSVPRQVRLFDFFENLVRQEFRERGLVRMLDCRKRRNIKFRLLDIITSDDAEILRATVSVVCKAPDGAECDVVA